MNRIGVLPHVSLMCVYSVHCYMMLVKQNSGDRLQWQGLQLGKHISAAVVTSHNSRKVAASSTAR